MRLVLWFVLVCFIGTYICQPVLDPDLWWHITAGRWIIAHHSLPQVDYWNAFAVDKPWRAYSWFLEIVFAWVDGSFGDRGLLTLQILMSVSLAFGLFYCMGKIANDWFIGAILGLFSTTATFNHFTLRPQSVVWIFFAALLYLANLIEREGVTPKRLLACAFVMCLWANTHITTVLGIFVLGAWLCNPFDKKTWAVTAKVVFSAIAGTLITPYMGGEWITFFSKTGHPFQHQAIAEFQAATIMQHSTAFLIIALAVVLLFTHLKPQGLSVFKALTAGAFCIAGLAIIKFLPFAVILLCTLIAEFWRNSAHNRSDLGNLAVSLEKLREAVNKIPREGFSFLLICMVIVKVNTLWRAPIDDYVVPVKAVDFMQSRQLPAPILNGFGNGGYIMYRYSDKQGNLEHRVPIDGRTNVVPHEVWEKFMNAELGKNKWREYIDLVKPKTILWKIESPLTSIFLMNNEWCEVFRSGDEDHGYGVYVAQDYFQQHKAELNSKNCA